MPIQAIETKFIPPPVRSGYVIRQRLFDLINQVNEQKKQVLLVSAPAGFGKTYLAATWIDQTQNPAAWFSIDKDDNEPLTFWNHFLYALQREYPGVAQKTSEILITAGMLDFDRPATEHWGESLRRAFLTSLINELNTGEISCLLFLDDVHKLNNAVIFEDLSFLFEYLPLNLKLVFLTRHDPILPVAMLRVRNKLVEIRTVDLQFTQDEMTAFLSRVMHLDLQDHEFAELGKRTDGWIAGLQIAALSMQSSDDPSSFIRNFTGSHRHILDYVDQEVLENVPEDIRSFLLKTSILDRFNLDLCRYIIGGNNEKALDCEYILSEIERKNLFLIPLDSQRIWFRYHSLFSALLQNTLKSSDAAIYEELHLRASEWCGDNGMVTEALDYVLHVGSVQSAAKLVEKNAFPFLMRGHATTVLKWIERLPIKLVYASARLCLDQIWAYLFTSQLFLAEQMIEYLENHPGFQQDQQVRNEIIATRAFLYTWKGDSAAVIPTLQQVVNHSIENTSVVFNLCLLLLAIALVDVGRLEEARTYYQRSLAESRSIGNDSGLQFMLFRFIHDLAITYRNRGQLHEAAAILRQALNVENEALVRSAAYFQLQSALGKVLMAQGKFAEAARCFQQGIETANSVETTSSHNCRINLTRLYLAIGKVGLARELMDESNWLERNDDPFMVANFQAMEALIHLELGNLERVHTWILQRGYQTTFTLPEKESPRRPRFYIEYELVIAAKYLISSQQYKLAEDFLEKLNSMVNETMNIEHMIDTHILQAILFRQTNRAVDSEEKLLEAIKMADESGFVFPFMDKGHIVVAMLDRMRNHSIHGEFISSVLSTNDQYHADFTHHYSSPPETKPVETRHFLRENISRREREILSLLAKGYSDKEIARLLTIAVSTVKYHNHNLYAKLNVNGRMQCVDIARELGLIPD